MPENKANKFRAVEEWFTREMEGAVNALPYYVLRTKKIMEEIRE
jgi:hypothetical protein